MIIKNILFLFYLLFNFIKSTPIDLQQLNIGVWLSGAAYCGKENYKTMNLGGPGLGFVYKDNLYDIKTDIQGYIGTLSSTKTIYVVLRGSSSTMNWLDDFEIKLVPYLTFPECNCNVHNGFYSSAIGIKNKTIETIKILKKIYPFYTVVITGHSYGAAVGQLLAMEIQKEGIIPAIYNYGQPRVGDKKYSTFVNTIIKELWRTTHNKDIVPHVPPIEILGYLHSCREIFENEKGEISLCSEFICEDPKCSFQYNIYETNSTDHLYYLGHRVDCSQSTI